MINRHYVKGEQNVQVPAHLNFGKIMLDQLRRTKDGVALECADTGETLRYKELTQYVVSLSAALSALGVRRGAVVALGSERRVACMPTALAVICTGAAYTPYDLHEGRGVLIHKMKLVPPQYLICSKQFWERYADVLRDFGTTIKTVVTLDDGPSSATTVRSLIADGVDVDTFEPAPVEGHTDTAIIAYSSGTTGMPKAVEMTHLNLTVSVTLKRLPMNNDGHPITAYIDAEWSQNYAIVTAFVILYSDEAKLMFLSVSELKGRLKYFVNSQVNLAFVNPAVMNWMMNVDDDEASSLDSVKIVVCSTSSPPCKLIDSFKQRYPEVNKVIKFYGMSEAGAVTSEFYCTKGHKPGTVGTACPGMTIKVVEPDTREVLGPHRRGEICIKGPTLMKGYIGVPRETYLDEEGFYKTGDLGYYDDDEYFFIVDRIKDVLKYNGLTIAPQELETILQLHPAVLEAAVVSKHKSVFGDEPAAFVVLKPGAAATEQELVDYVAAEVTPDMQLRGGVRFISELPIVSNGKVLRRVLRTILDESQ